MPALNAPTLPPIALGAGYPSYAHPSTPDSVDSLGIQPLQLTGDIPQWSTPTPGVTMEIDNNCNQMGPPPQPLGIKHEPFTNNNSNGFQGPSSVMTAGTTHKEVCAGCRRPIEDRFLLRVMENSWHESCLQCSLCQEPLTRSCFVKDRKLLCKDDYDKLYGARCQGCMLPIPAQELVMRALGQVYHLRCFTCAICGHQLQKGDQFVVKDGHLYCRMDFEKEFLISMSPKHEWGCSFSPKSDDDSSLDENCDLDAPKGPKRPRTILTTSQRRKFKASFEINPKPCRKVRETLAAETGLSVRVVQVWFQNQRAKMKKLARRQTSDGGSEKDGGKSGGKGSKHNGKKKKEDDDDSSPISGDHVQGQSADENQNITQTTPGSPSQQSNAQTPLQSTHAHSPHHQNHPAQFDNQLTPFNNPSTNSQDMYSSGMSDSLYGPSLAMDSGLDTLGEMLLGSSNTGPNSGQGPATNPMDKLYSMQNSYFTAD